jgi:hypothetical protein
MRTSVGKTTIAPGKAADGGGRTKLGEEKLAQLDVSKMDEAE